MNTTSGATVLDLSGHGYHATLSGAVTLSQSGATHDGDTSILFDAVGTLSLPYTLNITSMTTLGIEFWIKLSGVWEYVGVDYDGTTTTVYRNGAAYTPDSSAPVGIDKGFYWAGSATAG